MQRNPGLFGITHSNRDFSTDMRTVDLFSGCGGLSLGFQNVGFDIIAAFDNWQPAVAIYKENFNHPIYNVNLAHKENISLIKNIHPEIIIGGPPCQDFSSAGKRDETLGRADLTLSFANIVAAAQPQWFVMENVARIKSSRILQQAINIFENADYGLSSHVLDASYCGVPQSRKRFFLIGCRHAPAGFLQSYIDKNQSTTPMSLFDFFGKSLGVDYYYRHPRNYTRRGIFSIHEPSPTIRGVNRPIPKNYPGHPADPVHITPNVRPLTTKERSLIQTFPDDFILTGTKTNVEQAIGNAVPVKLGEFMARCIFEYINDIETEKIISNSQLELI